MRRLNWLFESGPKTLLLSVTIVAFFVGMAIKNNVLIYYGSAPFRLGRIDHPKSLPFSYSDATALLGEGRKVAVPFSRPDDRGYGVYVSDVNGDGFDDLLYLFSNESGVTLTRLYVNNRGQSFDDRTQSYQVPELVGDETPVAAGFADLDNDGHQDLVLSLLSGRFIVGFGNGDRFVLGATGSFQKGDGRSLALLDFDRDGKLDIYFASYSKNLLQWEPAQFARDEDCGVNFLYRNEGGRKFSLVPGEEGAAESRCTYGALAVDLDNDNFDDLLLSSNFGVDMVFRNEEGKGFRDVTRAAMGYLRSRSSMGIDAADLFGEGKLSVWVTNVEQNLGLKRGMNSLWYNQSTPGQIQLNDISLETATHTCGYSWGTKFLDPDRNGLPDLFVSNAITRPAPPSRWNPQFYFLNTVDAAQNILIRFYESYFFAPPVSPQFPRPCFFLNGGKGNEWINATASSGLVALASTTNSRSIATLDFDNNGQEDIVVGRMYFSPGLWRGVYAGSIEWIGFDLEGTLSNRDAIGAKLVIRAASGRKQMKIVNPGGSFQAQSSKKVIFALPQENEFDSIEITWPSGKRQSLSLSRFSRNSYNKVREE